jgi:hypothetical protein
MIVQSLQQHLILFGLFKTGLSLEILHIWLNFVSFISLEYFGENFAKKNKT